jgi:hypothetical protein
MTLGKTPAEAAGIRFPYSNWKDIVAKDIPSEVATSPKSTDVSTFDRVERGYTDPQYRGGGFKIASGGNRRHLKIRRRIPTVASISIMRR